MSEASGDATRKPKVEGCGMMLLGTEERGAEGPLEPTVAGTEPAVCTIWMSTSAPEKPRQKHALSAFLGAGVGLVPGR